MRKIYQNKIKHQKQLLHIWTIAMMSFGAVLIADLYVMIGETSFTPFSFSEELIEIARATSFQNALNLF